MPHSTLIRLPAVRFAPSLPPMHTWPRPVKQAVLGLCIALCVSAYIAIAIGLIGALSFALGLM
jgi:hypothetical protein